MPSPETMHNRKIEESLSNVSTLQLKKRIPKFSAIAFFALLLLLSCSQFDTSGGTGDAENFTITFDKNDAAATGTMTNQLLAGGASANLSACGYTKAGWTFMGWATTAAGTVAYADGTSYTMGTANVILYARWSQNFIISFDKNDVKSQGTMANQTIAGGASANLSACGYTNPGWTFIGWATTAAGAVEYANGASYTMGTANVTLYAKWDWAVYNLRDTGPAGGLIFYINPSSAVDGWKYLEAAPSDQTSRFWGAGTDVAGAAGTAIGTGKQNTLDIIAGDASADKAADECANLSISNGGVTFDDWFLPSKDELDQMYTNLKNAGVGGFSTAIYWSSSEDSATAAWGKNPTLVWMSMDKSNVLRIRAARAF